MSAKVHVYEKTVNPSAAPAYAGQHWVNTSNGRQWISNGTATVANWVEIYNGLAIGEPVSGAPDNSILFVYLGDLAYDPTLFFDGEFNAPTFRGDIVKTDSITDAAGSAGMSFGAGAITVDNGDFLLGSHLLNLGPAAVASGQGSILLTDFSGNVVFDPNIYFDANVLTLIFGAGIDATGYGGTIAADFLVGDGSGLTNVSAVGYHALTSGGSYFYDDGSGGVNYFSGPLSQPVFSIFSSGDLNLQGSMQMGGNLQNQGGATVIDMGNFRIKNVSGTTIFDINNGELNASSGATAFSLNSLLLSDSFGVTAMKGSDRQLIDKSNVLSVDWDLRQATNPFNVVVMDWSFPFGGNHIIMAATAFTDGIVDTGGVLSIAADPRQLLAPDGITVVLGWSTGVLVGDGSGLSNLPTTIADAEFNSGITPAADGTYAVPTSITIVSGIITAIS